MIAVVCCCSEPGEGCARCQHGDHDGCRRERLAEAGIDIGD